MTEGKTNVSTISNLEPQKILRTRLEFGPTTSEADPVQFKQNISECSTHVAFGKVTSECSAFSRTSFGKTTSDFSTLGPAFQKETSDFSALGPAFQKTTSDFSALGLAFQKTTSCSSLRVAFKKKASDLTAFTPQKLVSRYSFAQSINDADFELVQDDDGCDEIMNDEDLISHLAGGTNLCHEPIAEQSEEHSRSGKNKCPHATNPYNQENLWQRNALGGKAAGKRGFIFDPALPSVGTALHFYGGCIPCDYLATEEGCTMGKYCGFCHFCPPVNNEQGESMMRAQRRLSGLAFEQQLRETRHTLNQLQADARAKNATNVGSSTHFTGACSPCIFIHRAEGCKDAEKCIHCHLCDSSMYRMKKATRSEVGKRIKSILRSQRAVTKAMQED